MKRLATLVTITLLLTSCSLSKQEKTARKTVDGTWTLTKVTYDSPGTFNTTLFDDTTASCFEGSQWFFRSNNSTGSYNIINANCPTGERYIRWSANEIGKDTGNYDFTMKFTDEKKNDIQKNTGYRMTLNYLDDNSMQLVQTVNFEGKPFKINLNFTRITQ
ncbi:lipocalin family protein [Subsaxibacter sp. CAU 1640]|uniref:lipocalin family protein n=1 Tax=Subsaxibacter sp. CAU 1640 TaxID=2933271 RepID=UPI002004331B|nr:lipocalin family protein [Subsaxibacter sp. CAU 1640]MCK7590989.1 lipocalin family protein [Subsaxibacter sp. CAU 1640]